MPIEAERNLEAGARKHGFKKGSRRYNAYVYGTMKKLGILSSNHAGALGPDRLVKKIDLDYRPTFTNVHGVHIGVIVVLIFLVVWHVNRYHPYFLKPVGGASMAASSTGDQNGNGATTYVDVQSYAGWIATQYHPLSATSGALNGESN